MIHSEPLLFLFLQNSCWIEQQSPGVTQQGLLGHFPDAENKRCVSMGRIGLELSPSHQGEVLQSQDMGRNLSKPLWGVPVVR